VALSGQRIDSDGERIKKMGNKVGKKSLNLKLSEDRSFGFSKWGNDGRWGEFIVGIQYFDRFMSTRCVLIPDIRVVIILNLIGEKGDQGQNSRESRNEEDIQMNRGKIGL
jgi:hypothetical protein